MKNKTETYKINDIEITMEKDVMYDGNASVSSPVLDTSHTLFRVMLDKEFILGTECEMCTMYPGNFVRVGGLKWRDVTIDTTHIDIYNALSDLGKNEILSTFRIRMT